MAPKLEKRGESVTIRPQNSSQAQNLKTSTQNPEPKPQIINPKLQRPVCLGRIVLLPNNDLQMRIISTYIECII
mgnify:CR=1 FL=1